MSSRKTAHDATKRAGKPALISATLRESAALTLAPAGGQRVDRDKKILFGVKMGGFSSPNRHGIDGVEGTDYDRAAIQKALPMYEGLPAFADHPPRDKPNQERSIDDALGIYHAVRMGADGWYGDLHLVPSHRLCESLLDVAERDELAGLYSISHNADGTGKVEGTRYRVTEILEVRSCDVVTRGATTKTFFESREGRPMKIKLRQRVLESKLPNKTKVAILEMGCMEDDVAAEGGDWKDQLVNAVGCLVKSDAADDHAKAKKILALLEPDKAKEIEESDEEDGEAGTGGKGDDDKGKDDEKKKAAVEESRELAAIYGLSDRKALIESLAKLPDTRARIAVLKEIPKPGPTTKAPPGAPRTTVTESREPQASYDKLLCTPLR